MLVRRLPKVGFNNKAFATPVKEFFVKDLLKKTGSLDLTKLSKGAQARVIGTGKFEAGLEIKAHYFSAGAKAALEAAGGKAVVISIKE